MTNIKTGRNYVNKQFSRQFVNEISIIVFYISIILKVHGIKHSGKARRGDGNDLTANPKKLSVIGKELDKINRVSYLFVTQDLHLKKYITLGLRDFSLIL